MNDDDYRCNLRAFSLLAAKRRYTLIYHALAFLKLNKYLLFRREVEKIGNDMTEDKTISREEDSRKTSSASFKTDSVHHPDSPRIEPQPRVSIDGSSM